MKPSVRTRHNRDSAGGCSRTDRREADGAMHGRPALSGGLPCRSHSRERRSVENGIEQLRLCRGEVFGERRPRDVKRPGYLGRVRVARPVEVAHLVCRGDCLALSVRQRRPVDEHQVAIGVDFGRAGQPDEFNAVGHRPEVGHDGPQRVGVAHVKRERERTVLGADVANRCAVGLNDLTDTGLIGRPLEPVDAAVAVGEQLLHPVRVGVGRQRRLLDDHVAVATPRDSRCGPLGLGRIGDLAVRWIGDTQFRPETGHDSFSVQDGFVSYVS